VGKKKKFNDQPFAYHQEIELEIGTLTNLGSGLGRVFLPGEAEAKWVVMVPFTLPGERVRARVFRNHKNFSEADLVAVLTPSLRRVDAPCPVFGRCGGCQYQHLAYAEQLTWKQRQVAELLQHMAGMEFPVAPVIASPRQYGYRSKITPHFNPPRSRVDSPGGERPAGMPRPLASAADDFPIGFLRQGTRFDLVDVPRCAIATDGINARLEAARTDLQTRAAAGEFGRGGHVAGARSGWGGDDRLRHHYHRGNRDWFGRAGSAAVFGARFFSEQSFYPAGFHEICARTGGGQRSPVFGRCLLRQRPLCPDRGDRVRAGGGD